MTNLIQLYTSKYPQKTTYEVYKQQTSDNHINYPTQNRQLPKNEDYQKQKLKLGLSTIFIVGSCLMFSKGVQKNVSKMLDKCQNYIEYRLELNSLKEKGPIGKLFENGMRGVSYFINKAESINNITSLKDILFMKLMYKTKPTKAIHQSITTFFDKLSRKTVINSYQQTGKAFQKMENKFQELDAYILSHIGAEEKVSYNGKTYSVKELLALAKGIRDEVMMTVNAFMSPATQKTRHKYIGEATAQLYQIFWDASFKDFVTGQNKFKHKSMWQTFMAAEQMKDNKIHLATTVELLKNMLSCSSEDKGATLLKLLSDLRKTIPRFDNESYKQVKKLEWFAKNTEGLKSSKEVFLKELNKLTVPPKFNNVDPEIAIKIQNEKNTYIELITNSLRDDNPGQIQDLLAIYYKIAPFEVAKSGTLQSLKKAVKSFNNSVDLETSEYFDKVRDLVLGSAPTDVLTILLSTGLIAHDILKSKDTNQKTSVMLTSGIPLAGAVATTVISASKLVSGGKSLALGFISGFALNLIGKSADKYRLKHFNNNKN